MKHILIFATLVAATSFSNAAQITVDATGSRDLELSSGQPVPAGDTILVGYFRGLTDSQIVADQGNPSLLQSVFIPFGLGGTVGEGANQTAGRFTFITTAHVTTPGATFVQPAPPNNSQIYLWAFASSVSASAASEQGIYTAGETSWKFPTTDDGTTDATISLDDPLTALVGSTSASHVFLAPIAIPEPSTLALTGFVVAGIFGLLRAAKSGRFAVI